MGRNVSLSIGALILIVIVVALIFWLPQPKIDRSSGSLGPNQTMFRL